MDSIKEFQDINSDTALMAYVRKYRFVEDLRPTASQILGVYIGQLEGMRATITHRWYDPSGPFQNEPDIHKAKLQVDGYGAHEIAYEG